MITLNMDRAQLWREFRSDHEKAIYWLNKHYGGKDRFEKKCRELIRQSFTEHRNIQSDIVEYNSPNNNKWYSFFNAIYNSKSGTSTHHIYSFCVYKTNGSVGAFVPKYDVSSLRFVLSGVFIFTSHFFLRAKERLGIECKDETSVVKFFSDNPFISTRLRDPDEKGRYGFDLRLQNGIGRGVVVSDDPTIVEIRTCLTDKQLSYKQKKMVGNLINFHDACTHDTIQETIICRLANPNSVSDDIKKERANHIDMFGDLYLFDLNYMVRRIALDYVYLKRCDIDFWIDKMDAIYMATNLVARKLAFRFERPLPFEKGLVLMRDFARELMKIVVSDQFDDNDFDNYIAIKCRIDKNLWDSVFN